MVTDFFGAFLEDLSRIIKIPNLHPDSNNSCLIQYKAVQVQLEVTRNGLSLVAGVDLGAIPPGAYRENFFAAALKANLRPSPNVGIFAFSQQADHLILHELFPVKDLTANRVAEILPMLVEKGTLWKEAISKGEIPPIEGISTGSSGMFGL